MEETVRVENRDVRQQVSSVLVSFDAELITDPVVAFSTESQTIYEVVVQNKRRSGVADTFNLNYSGDFDLKKGDFIYITGDLRVMFKQDGETSYKYDYIYAKTIQLLAEEPDDYINKIQVNNCYIKELIESRKSYQNNDVDVTTCSVTLVRQGNKVGIFNLNSWGRDALYLAEIAKPNAKINFEGRLQSYTTKGGKRRITIVTYSIDKESRSKKEV